MNIVERFKNLSQKNYSTGLVEVDPGACTACRQCVRICPASALTMVGKVRIDRRSAMIDDANCIAGGACTAICDDNAITITRYWTVPDGGFRTEARQQGLGEESYPRIFTGKDEFK